MKNREKYREELINMKLENNGADPNSTLCDFVKSRVLPNYVTEDCSNLWCITCNKIFSFWLEEEYEEPSKPEVDWSKVPVDTLVRVRDREDQDWILRYFKGIDDENSTCRYAVWMSGATSKTAYGGYMCWKYCEPVEVE